MESDPIRRKTNAQNEEDTRETEQVYMRLRRLGERIREKRQLERLTLGDAAKQSGISAATLSRLERLPLKSAGRERTYHEPDMRTVAAITRWLAVPLQEVTGDSPATKPVHDLLHDEHASTPDIIEAHLRADRMISPETAQYLARMFRLAYEMGTQPRQQGENQGDEQTTNE